MGNALFDELAFLEGMKETLKGDIDIGGGLRIMWDLSDIYEKRKKELIHRKRNECFITSDGRMLMPKLNII